MRSRSKSKSPVRAKSPARVMKLKSPMKQRENADILKKAAASVTVTSPAASASVISHFCPLNPIYLDRCFCL